MSTNDNTPRGPVVVGVDGSPNSIKALRIALREAGWRGVGVRAVAVWQFPVAYGLEGSVYPIDGAELEKGARSTLDEAIADAFPDPADRAKIEGVTPAGSPSEQLITESKKADLLVVGARGHGGFVGLLLGSVSTQVVKHAHCPVLVVPPEYD